MFMDLLFKRYSNPYELMDQMILCGRFLDFICEFVEITNDDLLWEYYLHYPFLEVSYDEFKRRLGFGNDEPQPKSNLEATVIQSINILDNFVPDG